MAFGLPISPLVLSIALLPLLFRVVPFIVPGWNTMESYSLWDPVEMNRRVGQERDDVTTRWVNVGYWRDTEEYPDAAGALASKLIDFADAPGAQSILDIAHGHGDSLLLHLAQIRPPKYLHGLTSLTSHTTAAELRLVNTSTTTIHLHTGSASLRSSPSHPLNPMRKFLGLRLDPDGPPPYDLVYILDAIYHFPPSVPRFLRSIKHAVEPGTGVLTFTDIVPPSTLSPLFARLILSPLLGVPVENLLNRPASLEAYKLMVEESGWVNVKVQDWTPDVLPGFGKFLELRGSLWPFVGRLVHRAHVAGWRIYAVRAQVDA